MYRCILHFSRLQKKIAFDVGPSNMPRATNVAINSERPSPEPIPGVDYVRMKASTKKRILELLDQKASTKKRILELPDQSVNQRYQQDDKTIDSSYIHRKAAQKPLVKVGFDAVEKAIDA